MNVNQKVEVNMFPVQSILLTAVVVCASPLVYTNHWLANTSGGKDDHIGNFIENMVVRNDVYDQIPGYVVMTSSYWDEGGVSNALYQNGKRIGKNILQESNASLTNSRKAQYGNLTCEILQFYGRAFVGKLTPPPVGAEAPYVSCSNGQEIRSVVDPTALAFDLTGNLLIADQGPDQNIKIFAMQATPQLIRTFGDSGGVFAGPVRGSVADRRFWGIRGLGVDGDGNIYVGNTGIPMQVMGGTDIRVFSGQDSSLLWKVQGLSFVNSADAEMDSKGESVYLNAKRFKMDYKKSPGNSWELAAVTLDPFKYPDDPRLQFAMESVFIRKVGGKKMLYLTDMYSQFVAVFRFEENSEIAIPCAFFTFAWDGLGGKFTWMQDKRPTWTPWPADESKKNLRWMWKDLNGDGAVQANEFSTYKISYPFSRAVDVDVNGDIWYGGKGVYSAQFGEGGINHFKAGNLDQYGIPAFDLAAMTYEPIPYSDFNGGAILLKYLATQDVMFLAAGTDVYVQKIYRVENWSQVANRKTIEIPVPYKDGGPGVPIIFDGNTSTMVLPFTFTADKDYLYLGYIDNGPDAKVRGEITILSALDGATIGHFIPSADCDFFSGVMDLPNALNVFVRDDGSRVLFAEEDGKGKVMAYDWCPENEACSSTSTSEKLKKRGGLKLKKQGRIYDLLGKVK